MSPSKRKRSSPPPPLRRSARLRASASSSLPPPSQQRGRSTLSTDIESEETWPRLRAAATNRIGRYENQGRPNEGNLPSALTAFLDWLPDGGRESMARDIIDATTDDQLHTVFSNLLPALAMPMKTRSRPGTIISSPHARRLQSVEAVAATLDQPSEREKEFRDKCMERDGYRCVVTGHLDTGTWVRRGRPEDVYFAPVEAAHIIPFSYASWRNFAEPPPHISTAWEVLWRCFPGVRRARMTVESINSLANGLSLRNSVHCAFGEFAIAFRPTDIPNVYERILFSDFPRLERDALPESDRIEFKRAPGAEDTELPSAALLDCHYRLAEILNASGMAGMIDEHWRRLEDLKGRTGGMLRPDGGTDVGGYLAVALWERIPCCLAE